MQVRKWTEQKIIGSEREGFQGEIIARTFLRIRKTSHSNITITNSLDLEYYKGRKTGSKGQHVRFLASRMTYCVITPPRETYRDVSWQSYQRRDILFEGE
jgi:hypothetical protein